MAAAADDTGAPRRGMAWPQMLALVFGAVYLLVGIVGFFWTGGSHFADRGGDDMLIGLFMVNPLHNIVHILVGLAGLALARTLTGARTYGWLLFVAYAAVSVYGFIAIDKSWDFLAINSADNVLHVVTALIGLIIALAPVDETVGSRTARTA
jgi:Domain of unknown function (DUF4383)